MSPDDELDQGEDEKWTWEKDVSWKVTEGLTGIITEFDCLAVEDFLG